MTLTPSPQQQYDLKAVIGIILLGVFSVFFSGELSRIIARIFYDNGFPVPSKDLINLAFIIILARLVFGFGEKPLSLKDFSTRAIFFGILFGTLLIILSWSIALFTQNIAINFKVTTATNALFIGALMLAIHGFNEEYLIQKFVRRTIEAHLSKPKAVLITAICFPIIQALQGYSSFMHILSGYFIGILFTILAQRFGFIAAAFAHAAWSFIELVAIPEIFEVKYLTSGPFIYFGETYGTISLIISTAILIAALFSAEKLRARAH